MKKERKRVTGHGFRTKKEAEIAMKQKYDELLRGDYVEPSKMTCSQYLNDWMKHKQNLGRSTRMNYESNIKHHIVPAIGALKISELTPLLLQNFISDMRSKGLSEGTVKKIYNIIHTSLNQAVKLNLIPKNPASYIDKPKVKHEEMKVWTVDQVKQFIRVGGEKQGDSDTVKYRHFLACLIALHTGMRQGEILGLRWKDIDFESKLLRIQQILEHDGKGFKSGAKSKAGNRTINLPDDLVEALKERRLQQEQEKEHAQELYQDLDLVICTKVGTQVPPSDLYQVWKRLIQKAGLPHIRFHDIRHTHASILLMQGVHPKVVSERLFHSSITLTLDTYSHLMPSMQADATKAFNDLLK